MKKWNRFRFEIAFNKREGGLSFKHTNSGIATIDGDTATDACAFVREQYAIEPRDLISWSCSRIPPRPWWRFWGSDE